LITFEQARSIAAAKRPKANISTWGWDAGDRWILANNSEAADDTRMSVIKATGEYVEDYGIPGIDYEKPAELTPVGTR
jgi:hypothetical protein